MTRRPRAAISANPVLIGAVTTIVVVVAIYFAGRANQGLPFQPTRSLHVMLANGDALLKGNEVRIGGQQVGLVKAMRAERLPNGRTIAIADVDLAADARQLPVDSRSRVRLRSNLGLKYLELIAGRAKRNLKDGATIPLSRQEPSVGTDDLFNIYDRPTRIAMRHVTTEAGNALAARGLSLNIAIGRLPRLFRNVEGVARVLADPGTQLGRFVEAGARFTGALAPVAETQARFFGEAADTFGAFNRDPARLRATLERSGPTLAEGTRSFAAQRPFLRHSVPFSAALRDVAAELRPGVPRINRALVLAPPVLRATPAFARRLGDTLAAVRDVGADPTVLLGLQSLTHTFEVLRQQLRYLGPYQTVCNAAGYFATIYNDQITALDDYGFLERQLSLSLNSQDSSLGSQEQSTPANGENFRPNGSSDPAFAHAQPYAAAVDDKGNADCEGGQRGYPMGRLADEAEPGYNVVVNPHTPGNQGPTYAGRAHVPAGQTFDRVPQGLAPSLGELGK